MRLPTEAGAPRKASIAVLGRAVELGVTLIEIGRIGLSEVTVDVASVQNRYSVLDREREAVLDACDAAGIAFLPWRPVYPAACTASTAAQVALAWLLDRSPVVLPIPGTASLDHLAENVAAANLRLSDEQRERLDRIAKT
ncbi:aldo/keto reductase [Streptomyces longisporoflavus]|uniref:Aldo/keto reductase n=1 Tax=Streptomyces longisporoflavus TaxID=28044 RepID=A0ABW7QHQ5_9ACTN